VASDTDSHSEPTPRRHLRRLLPRTLRGRLALVAVAVVGAWLVVLTLGSSLVLVRGLSGQADDLLRTRAEAVATTVTTGPDGRVQVAGAGRDDALDAGVWIFAGTRLVEGSRHPSGTYAAAARMAQTGGGFRDLDDPGDTRLYAHPVLRGDRRTAVVVTATSLSPYRHAVRSTLASLLAIAALLLGVVYLVTREAVSRALAPVTRMAGQASAWSAAAASGRFGAADLPEELALLAGSLDEMLDRTSAVLRHEQRLTGELSHELRTPLSRIIAEADLLQSSGGSDADAEAAAAISETALQMNALLDTLLRAARSTPDSTPGRCELAEVFGRIRHLVPPGGIRLEIAEPPAASVVVGTDSALLERLLLPLLENAFRHARSCVRLTTEVQHDTVVIDVVDDGPGVPRALGDRVFEPGVRGDADGHDGAGLGLPLARRLAHAAGGTLRLLPATRPGAVFRLTLPTG
jgi:two-component system, OmpR family, heavy metal sensor histidine kinase CusS